MTSVPQSPAPAPSPKKARALLAAQFENSVLRRAAYLCLLASMGAGYAVKTLQGTTTRSGQLALYYLPLLSIWIPVLSVGLYYGYLAARRFRFSLAAFLVLGLVWCNLTAFTWALVGWEGGVTVALAAGAGVCFALCWSASVSRLLGWTGHAERVGLCALGLSMAMAWPGIVLGLAAMTLSKFNNSPRHLLYGLGITGASVLVLLSGAYLSFRARKAARKLLEAIPAPGA